jgi:hypothetical protein
MADEGGAPTFRWRWKNGSCTPWEPLPEGFRRIPEVAEGIEFRLTKPVAEATPQPLEAADEL